MSTRLRAVGPRSALLIALGTVLASRSAIATPLDLTIAQWTAQFVRDVDHRLDLTNADQARYDVSGQPAHLPSTLRPV